MTDNKHARMAREWLRDWGSEDSDGMRETLTALLDTVAAEAHAKGTLEERARITGKMYECRYCFAPCNWSDLAELPERGDHAPPASEAKQ